MPRTRNPEPYRETKEAVIHDPRPVPGESHRTGRGDRKEAGARPVLRARSGHACHVLHPPPGPAGRGPDQTAAPDPLHAPGPDAGRGG